MEAISNNKFFRFRIKTGVFRPGFRIIDKWDSFDLSLGFALMSLIIKRRKKHGK